MNSGRPVVVYDNIQRVVYWKKHVKSLKYQLNFSRINYCNLLLTWPHIRVLSINDRQRERALWTPKLKKKKFVSKRTRPPTRARVYENVAQSFFDLNFSFSKPINSAYLHITRPAYNARMGLVGGEEGRYAATKGFGNSFACGDFQRLRFKRLTGVRLHVLDHCRGGSADTTSVYVTLLCVRSLFSIVSTWR